MIALQHSTDYDGLKSGVVWRGSSSDVPEVVNNMLCVLASMQFADNDNLNHIYALKDSPLALGIKDLHIYCKPKVAAFLKPIVVR